MTGVAVPRADTHAEDRALAALCAASPPSRQAWDTLYAEHSAAVRAWIRRGWRAAGDDTTEDLLQQVFLQCARGALARYRGEVSLRSYLFVLADRIRISENRRLTRQRRDVRKRAALSSDADDGPDLEATLSTRQSVPHALGLWSSSLHEAPDAQVEAQSEVGRLQDLMSTALDATDREIVESHYWHHQTDRAIGERLDMATNTVTWRRHRSLALLKKAMQRRSSRPSPGSRKKLENT